MTQSDFEKLAQNQNMQKEKYRNFEIDFFSPHAIRKLKKRSAISTSSKAKDIAKRSLVDGVITLSSKENDIHVRLDDMDFIFNAPPHKINKLDLKTVLIDGDVYEHPKIKTVNDKKKYCGKFSKKTSFDLTC
jgi:murein L,D-transpeptidase YafK